MENYESLGTIGEGTYGVVLKCRHKATGQIVAIKKFKESDDDEQVKKTALREIKLLKQLKHENLVSLLEVFRVKGKLYLVFEFVEKTILEEIERHPDGLEPAAFKRLMWQLVRAIAFCHQHNIIHRDIKPENLLVSRNGVLKLCDFGFARPLAAAGAKYTEYVSTRWYRAPELLVGDVSYGKAVDVWAIGCMLAEIATGLPLFPGDSDIDQLYHIIRCLGHITSRQQELFRKNALYVGVKLPKAADLEPLDTRFPTMDKNALDFLRQTIVDEPLDRWTCAELLQHPFFENSHAAFEAELQEAIARDLSDTAAIRKKRGRKASRGASVTPTSSIGEDLLATGMAGVSGISAVESSKPLGKQLLSPFIGSQPKKDKTVEASNSKPGNAYQPPRKSPPGLLGSNGATGGGYHLPTLQGAMANSSSTSSTASSTATTSSSTSSSCGESNSNSPILGQYKKPMAAVPPIAEYHHQAGAGYAAPIPAEHLSFLSQNAGVRVSLTSHGSRLGGAVHPYASFMGAPAPKPPPSSYMKNPYAAKQPTTKRSTSKANGGFVASSLPSSMELYSPKRSGGRTMAHQATKSPAAIGNGATATPQGLQVPPRTSHSSVRVGALPPGGGHPLTLNARRDKDLRSY